MSAGLLNQLLGLKAAFGCLLLAIILIMAVIDSREMILPNRLNLVLAGAGLAQAIFIGQPTLLDASIGAFVAAAVLGSVAAVFRNLRGVDALGFGDQKFAAAAGLWIGWQEVAPMLAVASVSALAFVAIRSVRARRFDPTARVPFGPFLGLGTLVSWLATIAYQ